MSPAVPTHRVLGRDLRVGDLLIGGARGGALADLPLPTRIPVGTISGLAPRTCPITGTDVLDARVHGGWAPIIRLEADGYCDVRRAS